MDKFTHRNITYKHNDDDNSDGSADSDDDVVDVVDVDDDDSDDCDNSDDGQSDSSKWEMINISHIIVTILKVLLCEVQWPLHCSMSSFAKFCKFFIEICNDVGIKKQHLNHIAIII